jgi:hypothetical protein
MALFYLLKFYLYSRKSYILWHDAWKLQSAHLLGGSSLSTFPWQHGRRRCWTDNCWDTFPRQQIRLKKQCIACRVKSIPRQRIHKRFRSHGNESPKHSNSEERDISAAEGGDLHTVRPKPTSGKELTNRRQNTIEHRRQTEVEVRNEVFILCRIVTVTFKVLSLILITKCYSYSKTVLKPTVVSPGEYPINWFI